MRYCKYITSIMLFVIFMFATVDTHWFVYPSLSRSLLMETGILFGALLIFPFVLANKFQAVKNTDMLILAWIGYVAIHALIVTPHETYRTTYLCCSLLFCVSLSIGIRIGIIRRAAIENCILMAAMIHLIYITGQSCGIIESGNNNFLITGSNENPTVTALYLTACIPLMVSRIKKGTYRIFYIIFLIAAFCAIIFLRCRTAYIGLIVEFVVYISAYRKVIFPKMIKYIRYRYIFAVAVSAIAVFSLTRLYLMKQDSADGRLLIWKISTNMIAENPLGYGYGLFEKNYNLKQAEYFEHGEYSKTEKRNADSIYMAYNDYLEHGVEGGIIGIVFLGVFYCFNIRKALHNKRTEDTAITIAFAVMSLTNFVYSSILPWLLFMCYTAFCNSTATNKLENTKNKMFGMTATATLLVFTILLTYKTISMTMAQYQLNRIETIRKGRKAIDDKFYADIESEISTSEAYWKSRASNYMANNDFRNAVLSIQKARLYSSSPQLFYKEKQCQMFLENTDSATQLLTTLSYMLPRDLTLKHELMLYHDMSGNKSMAIHYADDILATDIKKPSSKKQTIINHALKLKRKYEK